MAWEAGQARCPPALARCWSLACSRLQGLVGARTEGLALLQEVSLLTALPRLSVSRPPWSVIWFCSTWMRRLTSIGRRSLRR